MGHEFINYILAKWYGTKPKILDEEEAIEEEEILLYQNKIYI